MIIESNSLIIEPGRKSISERWTVDSFDTDLLGYMRLVALVRRLQNAADSHARCHHLAVDQLLQTGRTWVLREFHLRIHRTPRFQEPCTVSTWASSRSAGIKAWRDFTLHSDGGELLAVATSMWLMLDVSRWKLMRLPEEVFGMVNTDQGPVMTPIAAPLDFVPHGVENALGEHEVAVHWLDLDFNGHVNNVRYLDWMMAAVPGERWQQQRVHELVIDFRSEARPGDRLYAAAQFNGDGCAQHRICNGNGGLVALAATNWNSRPESASDPRA